MRVRGRKRGNDKEGRIISTNARAKGKKREESKEKERKCRRGKKVKNWEER